MGEKSLLKFPQVSPLALIQDEDFLQKKAEFIVVVLGVFKPLKNFAPDQVFCSPQKLAESFFQLHRKDLETCYRLRELCSFQRQQSSAQVVDSFWVCVSAYKNKEAAKAAMRYGDTFEEQLQQVVEQNGGSEVVGAVKTVYTFTRW